MLEQYYKLYEDENMQSAFVSFNVDFSTPVISKELNTSNDSSKYDF